MNKQDYIIRCVDLLDETYTRESGVMQNVISGLNKMSKSELSSLYSVLLTRVVVKEVKIPEKPNPLFSKGDVLLCVRDFQMTSGELAFKKGEKYTVDRVITYVGKDWVDYDMDSLISSKHTMPEKDVNKFFQLTN